MRWWATPYGWSNKPSLAVLSGVSTGPASAGIVRSIQRGVIASPALVMRSSVGQPSLSRPARSTATAAGR